MKNTSEKYRFQDTEGRVFEADILFFIKDGSDEYAVYRENELAEVSEVIYDGLSRRVYPLWEGHYAIEYARDILTYSKEAEKGSFSGQTYEVLHEDGGGRKYRRVKTGRRIGKLRYRRGRRPLNAAYDIFMIVFIVLMFAGGVADCMDRIILKNEGKYGTEDYDAACSALPETWEYAEKLRDVFVIRGWENISEEEKLRTVKQIVDWETVNVLGCLPVSVEAEYLPGNEAGHYEYATNTIRIDRNVMRTSDWRTIINIAAHESRHVWQYEMVELYDIVESRNLVYERLNVLREAGKYKDNIENYVRADDSLEGYAGQTIEEDSRQWAQKRISEFYELILAPETGE